MLIFVVAHFFEKVGHCQDQHSTFEVAHNLFITCWPNIESRKLIFALIFVTRETPP